MCGSSQVLDRVLGAEPFQHRVLPERVLRRPVLDGHVRDLLGVVPHGAVELGEGRPGVQRIGVLRRRPSCSCAGQEPLPDLARDVEDLGHVVGDLLALLGQRPGILASRSSVPPPGPRGRPRAIRGSYSRRSPPLPIGESGAPGPRPAGTKGGPALKQHVSPRRPAGHGIKEGTTPCTASSILSASSSSSSPSCRSSASPEPHRTSQRRRAPVTYPSPHQPARRRRARRRDAGSYVDWAAILAGARPSAALSLVLLTFGSAIGLTMVSAEPGEGVSLAGSPSARASGSSG